jgi:vancomycin aglycone glucosyltransferase
MKIAIVVNGTRGDVQPMLALATGLINNSHEIVFCGPPENEEFAKQYNCPFVAFGPNYKELFKQKADMKGGAATGPSPREGKRDTENQINLLPEIIKGSHLVLGVGFILGVHTVADFLKIPYRFVVFYPVLLGTCKSDPLFSRMMFGFGRFIINMFMKGFINKKRDSLGLNPIKDVWEYWMGDNVIVACDKELNTARKGVSFNFTQTGYMLLASRNGLPEHVEKFLNSGKPPVFIGFGSNPVARPEKYSQIFNEVSKATNQRLIVSKGWADLPEGNSSDILYVDELPFDLLFPGLAAAIYHGGTGTMAAIARAGIPQAAFPFMADQFSNRDNIFKLGLGPKTCNFKEMTADSISTAINECINNNTYKKNAIDISNKLKISNGTEQTILLIEKEFLNKTSYFAP